MLLSRIEAALRLGTSIELLDYFTEKCPKKGEARLLKAKTVDGDPHYDSSELDSYAAWLSKPWPLPEGAARPHIPTAIAKDVREECHHSCAICGGMDNGELAHICAVADSLDNSPANLILLCPNHHTKYDLGYKPLSNISLEVVSAAKLMKRTSRQRMMRAEANLCRCALTLTRTMKAVERQLKNADDPVLREALMTESKVLLADINTISKRAVDAGRHDRDLDPVDTCIAKKLPKILKLTAGGTKGSDASVRATARQAAELLDDALVDIDEVECPHCAGRGMTGLVGDLCAFCGGDCVVSDERAASYDKDDIDEASCPHCAGRGQTGLSGDLCAYCGGSCVVSSDKLEAYDPSDIDEVDCPHCEGKGQTGLAGDLCVFCGGSCVVSREKADRYDRSSLDEVEFPHCNGRGQTGIAGDLCSYCGGSCTVSNAKAERYSPENIDEVECPHCGGRGQTGISGSYCKLCKGSQVVSREKRRAYRKKYDR